MSGLLRDADEIPVTLIVAAACVTLAMLTDPFAPTQEQLAAYGWLTPFTAANGEPWRLVSSTFLHGGILHIACNLSSLMALGPALERTLGSVKFAILWLVAGLGGSVGVCLWNDIGQPVVGASGSLFGLLGALVALNMRAGRHVFSFLDYEGPRRLLGTIVAYLVIGYFLPMISNTAHVGGLLGGFWVTFLWLAPGRRVTRATWHWRAATTALAAGCLFWSLAPATRFDVVWNRSVAAAPERRQALQRAAAMDRFGLPQAGAHDVARFFAAEIEGPVQQPQKPRGK